MIYLIKFINQKFKKKLPLPIPVELLSVILGTSLSYAINLETKYKVDIIGELKTGYLNKTNSVAFIIEKFSLNLFICKFSGAKCAIHQNILSSIQRLVGRLIVYSHSHLCTKHLNRQELRTTSQIRHQGKSSNSSD
jgi:hypothetical protein